MPEEAGSQGNAAFDQVVLPDLEEFAQLEQEPLGVEAQTYFGPSSEIPTLPNVLCVHTWWIISRLYPQ